MARFDGKGRLLKEVLYQVAGAAAGVVNFLPSVFAAVRVGVVADLGRSLVRPASAVWVRSTGRSSVRVASRVTTRGSGVSRPSVRAATMLKSVSSIRPAARTVPALDVVHTTVSVVATRNAVGSTGYAVGANNQWATPAAADGPPSGPDASDYVGSLTASKGGGVQMPIASYSGKTLLTITQVRARFHVSQGSTNLNNGSLTVGYQSSAGVRTQLAAYTANVDGRVTPFEFDLTSVIAGDWSNIGTTVAALYVQTSTVLGNNHNAQLKGMAFVVSATRTDVQ